MNVYPPCGIGLPQGGIFLTENYDVLLGDKPVGKAYVERKGLYYRIRCRCGLSGEVIYKVLVSCGGEQENLGILVPVGEEFGLDTRIPVKRLGEGSLSFRAMPRHSGLRGKFVPISPEEPFRYIARLKDAFLETRNGQIGIVIKEPGCE